MSTLAIAPTPGGVLGPIEPFKMLDIAPERYHARLDFVSKSMLSVFADSPAKFKYVYLDGGEKPESDAMRLGTAAHLYALEPEKFSGRYYVMPDGIRRDERTKAYQEQLAIAAGRTILKPAERDQIEGMANSLMRNPKAVALLKGDKAIETSIFWRDAEHGVNLRCRPDVIRLSDGVIVNLKTTRSARPETFFRAAYDMHYDVSVAMESRGFQAATGRQAAEYVFLAIETEPPYIVEAFNSFEACTDEGLTYRDIGEYRLRKLLARYSECVRENRWPSYQDNISPMRVPAWELKRLEMI